jgi:hypothetical protein
MESCAGDDFTLLDKNNEREPPRVKPVASIMKMGLAFLAASVIAPRVKPVASIMKMGLAFPSS